MDFILLSASGASAKMYYSFIGSDNIEHVYYMDNGNAVIVSHDENGQYVIDNDQTYSGEAREHYNKSHSAASGGGDNMEAMWTGITTTVTNFGTVMGTTFETAIQNPICLTVLGISIFFASIKGVKKMVRAFKGVK